MSFKDENRCLNAIWPKGESQPIRCEREYGHLGNHTSGNKTWTSERESYELKAEE